MVKFLLLKPPLRSLSVHRGSPTTFQAVTEGETMAIIPSSPLVHMVDTMCTA